MFCSKSNAYRRSRMTQEITRYINGGRGKHICVYFVYIKQLPYTWFNVEVDWFSVRLVYHMCILLHYIRRYGAWYRPYVCRVAVKPRGNVRKRAKNWNRLLRGFPHSDRCRFFFWNTMWWVDNDYVKRNSFAICSRFNPRLTRLFWVDRW